MVLHRQPARVARAPPPTLQVCAEVQDWQARPKPLVATVVECLPKRWMGRSLTNTATRPKHLPSPFMIKSAAKYYAMNRQTNFTAMP
jgi:hypothetical protein